MSTNCEYSMQFDQRFSCFAPSQVATDHAAPAALEILDTKRCCPQLLDERVCVAFRHITLHKPQSLLQPLS